MSIEIEHLWIHRADDTDVYVQLPVGQISPSLSTPQTRRRTATGRTVVADRAGADRTLDIEFPSLTRAQITGLEEMIESKAHLMVREPWGRILWGRFERINWPEMINVDRTAGFTARFIASGDQTAEV